MQALFAVHHCGKNSQAELDSFTIGQLSVSRGGPSIERAVSASRCLTDNAITFARRQPRLGTRTARQVFLSSEPDRVRHRRDVPRHCAESFTRRRAASVGNQIRSGLCVTEDTMRRFRKLTITRIVLL